MNVLAAIAYTKLRQIGVGQGMNSKVYLADEPQLGGRVAVKEIEKGKFGNPANYFSEAQVMFRSAHQNVVRVQYGCQTADIVSLVMPYYGRGSLADRIADRPLRLSELRNLAQAVLAGLAHIHITGYIHFDIKPSNVLFTDTGVPMVADFGQSRSISPTGVVTVPPLYFSSLPPETVATGTATLLADIYQAGLLLYRALNGDGFFTGQLPPTDAVLRAAIAAGRFPDRRAFMPHVPRRLRTLVRKALRTRPGERFQSATELADALSRVPILLDWSAEPLPAGGFRWRAARPGQADLVVERTNRGGMWDVATFTEKPGEPRRAKDRKAHWRSGLTDGAAEQHLKAVFERLLQ